jgi:hypothetical protein
MKISRTPYLRFKRYMDKGIPLSKLQSLILEEDHTASRQHDLDLVAPVSRKAHQRLERNRNAARIERAKQSNSTRRVMWALRSTAVFLELLAEALWRWSEELQSEEP